MKIRNRHRRALFLIAAIAIGIALLLLLVPHAHGVDNGAWLAVLPIFFVGVISPLSLLSPLAVLRPSRTPESPVLPASFQRPPPCLLA